MSDVEMKREDQGQRFCAKCGSALDPGARFCGACGTPADGELPSGQEWKRLTEDVKSVTRVGMENARKGVAKGMQFAGEKIASAAENLQQEKPAPPVMDDAQAMKEEKPKKKLGKVASAVVVVIVLFLIWSAVSRNPVRDIKDVVFDQYGTETLGDAIKESIPEARWESEKVGDKQYKVTVSGFCPDLSSVIQVNFDVNYAGDYIYAKPLVVWMDAESYDDIFSIALVMQAIY